MRVHLYLGTWSCVSVLQLGKSSVKHGHLDQELLVLGGGRWFVTWFEILKVSWYNELGAVS